MDTPTEKPILAVLFDRLPTNQLISSCRSHLTTRIMAAIRLTTANGGWFNQFGRDWSIPFVWDWSTCPFSPSNQRLQEKIEEDQLNTYTKLDVWILMARINQTILNDRSDLLAQLNSKRITDSLIQDFEKRFSCNFDEVVKANPEIQPGQTDLENRAIVERYAHLKYSR